MMKATDTLFFELIRVAIGNTDSLSRNPSNQEWKALFDMAKRQSLVGVCFAAFQRLGADADEGFTRIGISEMLYLTWMGMAAKIQQKNEEMNQRCVELQEKLSAEGYRSYIMKGQANASLYQVRSEELEIRDLSVLRQSGDIDIFIEGGLKNVLACAEKFGGASGVNEMEMHVNVFDDTEVEFHYRPSIMRNPMRNKRLQKFYSDCAEKNFSNSIILDKKKNLSIIAPTTEFNLVHQMTHIHLHLFTEGVGMRQLMDYYFIIRTVKNVESVKESIECIRDLGLERFASALMWVFGYVFGLRNEYMLWRPNEEDGKLLLSEVMIGGNFGRHNEEQNDLKKRMGYSVWALFFRNLRLSRFDRWDWFWGPIWRVSHKLTKKI